VTGKADHHGPIQAFGQKPEHHLDLIGLGFEIVQGRAFPDREGFAAGLTTEFANGLGLINPAIADQGVNGRVGDAEIITPGMRTSMSGGVNAFLSSSLAFTL
jgi:hypothetical protein